MGSESLGAALVLMSMHVALRGYVSAGLPLKTSAPRALSAQVAHIEFMHHSDLNNAWIQYVILGLMCEDPRAVPVYAAPVHCLLQ